MAKLAVRLRAVEVVVGGALVCIAGRAAQLQLLEGRRWAEEARAQRTEHVVLPARRGALTDRHGTPLALTQETYHVGVAVNELRDPAKDVPRIARRLRLATADVEHALRRRYAYFAGPYSVISRSAQSAAYTSSPCSTGSIPRPTSPAPSSAGWVTTAAGRRGWSARSTACSRAGPARPSC